MSDAMKHLIFDQLKAFHDKHRVGCQRDPFCGHAIPSIHMISLKFFHILSVTLTLNESWVRIAECRFEYFEVTDVTSWCTEFIS